MIGFTISRFTEVVTSGPYAEKNGGKKAEKKPPKPQLFKAAYGAVSDYISDYVSVDSDQNFTDAQKEQGRNNINAVSTDVISEIGN